MAVEWELHFALPLFDTMLLVCIAMPNLFSDKFFSLYNKLTTSLYHILTRIDKGANNQCLQFQFSKHLDCFTYIL